MAPAFLMLMGARFNAIGRRGSVYQTMDADSIKQEIEWLIGALKGLNEEKAKHLKYCEELQKAEEEGRSLPVCIASTETGAVYRGTAKPDKLIDYNWTGTIQPLIDVIKPRFLSLWPFIASRWPDGWTLDGILFFVLEAVNDETDMDLFEATIRALEGILSGLDTPQNNNDLQSIVLKDFDQSVFDEIAGTSTRVGIEYLVSRLPGLRKAEHPDPKTVRSAVNRLCDSGLVKDEGGRNGIAITPKGKTFASTAENDA